MERIFERIAYSRDLSFFYEVFLFPLYLLSLLYGIAVKIRLALYSSGVLKAKEFDCKVISVGNITVGGTGKTPTVELIARNLRDRGYKVAIISRGYKRKGEGIGMVSDGKDILLGPEEAGDEPYMLARRLKGIPVLVGTDRYKVGKYAIDNLSLDVLVLDDGFQHIKLKRDLDILLIDGERGLGNGHLIPRGPLREPPSGVRRAGVVLINKASQDTPQLVEGFNLAPVFKTRYLPERLVSLWSNEEVGIERLDGARVMALSGIASPSSFLNLLSSLGGIVVCEESLPDHYPYALDDLISFMEKAGSSNAEFIVTTEKDAVKLEKVEPIFDRPIYYLDIELDMGGDEQRFVGEILTRVWS